ncbi:MAG: 3D-(3,5/4)-trihydroxycyclohexane-1,2-dione acylhydrolase (decyclizing) [Acetobacteraceae bacterium]|nr:3D-(3,5/4)-trihydroxycyclohexane-1,2-dione acylhydrolase (decyclizing) [Acetobacteraceae bacterium]
MTARDGTIRLTCAQALVHFLAAQRGLVDGVELPLFAGIWAIFGHGNVAALGEALHEIGDALPTFRGQNEQSMALAAIAYAKATRRRRMMAVTSSIGPGATNMVTAAAVAHVNRLPLLLLPGDVFAGRRPDPVLQQVEDFADATVSANDCFRPVSRYFDRIVRPEQLLAALPRAMAVLTDPAQCGPVTLALCQDTQAEAFDYPESFFAPRLWRIRRPPPDAAELAEATTLLREAKAPLIIAGGGVHYAGACDTLARFAAAHGIPVTETQAGKSALAHDHPLNLGAVGVSGTAAANAAAEAADLILAVGTRLGDFATGSWALFRNPSRKIVALNVQAFDAGKRLAAPLVADADLGLQALSAALAGHRAPDVWLATCQAALPAWRAAAASATAASNTALPTDAQVLGAVRRAMPQGAIVVAAAGGLPGELHKLWNAAAPGSYHLEYGYSCMGYEIAGGLGVKMALPDHEVVVLLGDGSWLMMNAELATSVMLGRKLIVVLLDNGGFGCIDRLQRGTGGAAFNNLFATARHDSLPAFDFAAQAAGLGALALTVTGTAELEAALATARAAERTTVIVLKTDPAGSTEAGGHWWDVAVPEVSRRAEVRAARAAADAARLGQRLGN